MVSTGGFGGHVDQDAHILYTLSALQVLVIYDALDWVDIDAVTQCTFWYNAPLLASPTFFILRVWSRGYAANLLVLARHALTH